MANFQGLKLKILTLGLELETSDIIIYCLPPSANYLKVIPSMLDL